jgi:hypothetical protein
MTTMSFSINGSLRLLVAAVFSILFSAAVFAQTTSFTYQGRFTDGGTAANGIYDMQFKLYDGSGNQIGSTITNGAVTVTSGVFTVSLDYGAAAFPGADRFIEIGVRLAGNTDPYAVLSPRQQLSSTPYAIRAAVATAADTAISAKSANDAAQLGGVAASQYVQTSDSRLSDGRLPLPGSGLYIQNGTSVQANANFNVSGDGTAGGTLAAKTINAATQYNIAGVRALSIAGTADTFVGGGTGLSNSGDNNSFVGAAAGFFNTTGGNNSFFGAFAGSANTIESENAFFGYNAGRANTALQNSFFGTNAGMSNTTGQANAFFGYSAGKLSRGDENSFFGYKTGAANTSGGSNSFFGDQAGEHITTGGSNSIFGAFAGNSNTIGNNNVFVGGSAGQNSTGSNNTFIGGAAAFGIASGDNNTALGANTQLGNLTYATAIGANAVVTQSHTIVLGTQAETVSIPGSLFVTNRISLTPGGGGSSDLCYNPVSHELAFCSSSLRYKKDLQPFTRGLAVLNQLKPITFKWKAGNMPDLGFGAEDVARVEPLLVTHNEEGEIEGVKYDRITAVLVNAVKEQQEQIGKQQAQLVQQQTQINALRRQLIAVRRPGKTRRVR